MADMYAMSAARLSCAQYTLSKRANISIEHAPGAVQDVASSSSIRARDLRWGRCVAAERYPIMYVSGRCCRVVATGDRGTEKGTAFLKSAVGMLPDWDRGGWILLSNTGRNR
jgi:hypothetical protein